MSKKTKGRRKLEMVKIPNESNLLISFCKRKYGIFKKANELATLCGAEIAVIVFSPSMKVFSFGHPSVESVINRFLFNTPSQTSHVIQLIETHRNAKIRDLNMQLNQVLTQLEKEQKRSEELQQLKKSRDGQRWWDPPIKELDLSSLEQLKTSLEVLKDNAAKRMDQLLIQTMNHPQFCNPNHSDGAVPFDPKNDGFF